MIDLDSDLWGLPVGTAVRLALGSDAQADVLTGAERLRHASFGAASRRAQFLLGRTAARTLASDRLGLAPQAVPLRVAEDGAPEVPGGYLSIAHTGRGPALAAAAALARQPVGVDLEAVAPRRPDLWRRLLREEEHALLDALGGPTDDAQTLLWTLKEAVLKGQRTGFRAGGRSVRLALDADGAPPERGQATADAGSGAWSVAYGRVGDLWVSVAWQK